MGQRWLTVGTISRRFLFGPSVIVRLFPRRFFHGPTVVNGRRVPLDMTDSKKEKKAY